MIFHIVLYILVSVAFVALTVVLLLRYNESCDEAQRLRGELAEFKARVECEIPEFWEGEPIKGSYAWAVKKLEDGEDVRRRAWDKPRASKSDNNDITLLYVERDDEADYVCFIWQGPDGVALGRKRWVSFLEDVSARDWEVCNNDG